MNPKLMRFYLALITVILLCILVVYVITEFMPSLKSKQFIEKIRESSGDKSKIEKGLNWENSPDLVPLVPKDPVYEN